MKTDEEKATIRSELGPAFFARLAEGVCPYCEKLLGPVPDLWPNLEQLGELRHSASACADCESIFTDPDFGGLDDDDMDDDHLDGLAVAEKPELEARAFLSRWERRLCPYCEKPLAEPIPSAFPADVVELLGKPELVGATACNACPRLFNPTPDGAGLFEWNSTDMHIHALMGGPGFRPALRAAAEQRKKKHDALRAKSRAERARRKQQRSKRR